MSNIEWQNIFKELGLSMYDPIRITSFKTKLNFFTFDELDFRNTNGKEVMRQRNLCNINNGMVLLERHVGFNYMLTLGTGFKRFDARKYYNDNRQELETIFKDLKNIVRFYNSPINPSIIER